MSGPDESPLEIDDEALALHLDGLLEDEDARRVERALARDAGLRERSAALASLVGEGPVRLPAVDPPAGLVDVVLARLEAEGLVEPGGLEPGAAAPAGPALLGSILGRLEAEGLVDSARDRLAPAANPDATAEVASRRPSVTSARALVAALLAGLVLGVAGARLARPSPAPLLPVRLLTAHPAWPAHERVVAALGRALEATSEAARRADRARREGELERDLAIAAGRAAQAERDLALTAQRADRAERDAAREDARAARDGALAAQREALAARDRAQAERERAVAERDLALADLATARDALEGARGPQTRAGATTLAASLSVADARGVVRWDAPAAAWRPVVAGTHLAPGAIVRGDGPSSGLVVEGTRYALRDGVFVVAGPAGLEPVPVSTGATAAPARDDSVPALIARFSGGGPSARADAQRRLVAAWRELGDPGRGVLGQLASDPRARDGVPPTTARGWEEWWARVRRR